ncbi:tetratricopeptide repeat protein [Shewanella sp. 202IG2-18]|uniref:tetratricopeptide repeat protein n=1 Tax=Parashewanella hymeniacidonis TaxID=2807618 RepID=UPI00195FAF2F|nr:tetratricopeptide repeat protein [Parashewanella hymeniacidonis]MBM7073081.1 tetratricopeptide repeat protein [Parashewanella hymeniacidonis]
MSVINKMLKDLDNRQQPHGIENISAAQKSSQQVKPNRLPWILIVLMLIASVSYYLFQKTVSTETAPKSTNSQVLAEKPFRGKSLKDKPEAQAAAELEPTVITKVKKPLSESSTEDKTSKAINTNVGDRFPNTKKIEQRKQQQATRANDKKNGFDATPHEAKTTSAQPKKNLQIVAQRQSQIKPVDSVLEIKEVKLSTQELANKFAKQALSAELSGELSTARENYAKALALDKAKHSVRAKLAALYYGEHDNRQAVQLLDDGIKRFPSQSEFKLLLAKIQAKDNKPLQSLKTLNTIADTDNLAAEKWVQQGTIAQQQKQYLLAIKAFQKLTSYEPSQARWWLGLAYNQDASGQYPLAVKSYQRALQQANLSRASREYIVSRLSQITHYK